MALALRREFGFDSRPERLRSAAGEHMRIKQDIRQTVAFVGHMDTGEAFQAAGTAFLLMHDRLLYLVTARHIAEQLGDDPFYLFMNHNDGGRINAHLDLLELADKGYRWFFHEDPNVDLAVLPACFDLERFGWNFLLFSSEMAVIREQNPSVIGCGDFCYVVGLFSLHPGKGRITPVVHTGHIAMMPDEQEKIETQDWRGKGTIEVEGYLVEISNLQGLSGSPVLVRPSRVIVGKGQKGTPLTGVVGAEQHFLLGVWQGSWEGRSIGLHGGPRVPVGMGIVTPAEKLIELLDSPACKSNRRDYWQRNWTAKPDGAAA